MTKKMRTILGFLLVLILISVGINLQYAMKMRIDEPIYVKRYERIDVNENSYTEIRIQYIKDRYDDRELTAIKFDELDQIFDVRRRHNTWSPFENEKTVEPGQGRYYTFSDLFISFSFDQSLVERIDEKGDIILTHATLYFDDESTLDVAIGEVTLGRFKVNSLYREGASGSDCTFEAKFDTKGSLYITGFDLSTYEAHKDHVKLSIEVDGMRTYSYEDMVNMKKPIIVTRGLEVHYDAIKENKNQQWRFSDICPVIYYEQDQKESLKVYYNFLTGILDDESVEAYVKMWRELND